MGLFLFNHMNEIELTQKLISFDSQSQKSNKEIVDYLAHLFIDHEVIITKLDNNGVNIYNLMVRIVGLNSSKPLIFSGHTDTVPVSDKWSKDPFGGEIIDDKVFGLGSSDMKGGIASFVSAVLDIKEKPNRDIVLLFDADEEDGSIGGKDFLSRLSFDNIFGVVIAEPTDGLLVAGHKGVMDIKIKFKGIASHSSQTSWENNKDNNSIYKASQFIEKIQGIEQELYEKKYLNFNAPTQSVCKIQGGSASNVIADSCKLTINRRLLPNEDVAQYLQQIKNIACSIDSEVEIEVPFMEKGNLLDLAGPLFSSVKIINEEIFNNNESIMADYWTQAGLFNKWGDCLVWGPGEVEQAHKADEFCYISKITKMKDCYSKLITRL